MQHLTIGIIIVLFLMKHVSLFDSPLYEIFNPFRVVYQSNVDQGGHLTLLGGSLVDSGKISQHAVGAAFQSGLAVLSLGLDVVVLAGKLDA